MELPSCNFVKYKKTAWQTEDTSPHMLPDKEKVAEHFHSQQEDRPMLSLLCSFQYPTDASEHQSQH